MRFYFVVAMFCFGINAANAAKVDCSKGGQYQGSYSGPDSGIASVHVDANTGIVAGSATSSQNGKSIAIAGVPDSTGGDVKRRYYRFGRCVFRAFLARRYSSWRVGQARLYA